MPRQIQTLQLIIKYSRVPLAYLWKSKLFKLVQPKSSQLQYEKRKDKNMCWYFNWNENTCWL